MKRSQTNRSKQEMYETMAKWVSPAEQRERVIQAKVAQLRSAATMAVNDLVESWHGTFPTTYPDTFSNLILRTVNTLVREYGATYGWSTSDQSEVKLLLGNELERPIQLRYHAQQRAAQKAAEALVDTNRPVVARTGNRNHDHIGDFSIVTESAADRYGRVLVCIGGGYDAEDDNWHMEYADPNEVERASEAFQRLAAKIERKRADDAAWQAQHDAKRQEELDAIRAEGREPTFFEEMFAGTSDN